MEYFLINSDLTCGGIVGTEPFNNNWTVTPYLGGLIKEQWNGSDWVEGATASEVEAGLKKILITEIKAKYEFHKSNGWNAYQEFRAMIVVDIANAVITEQQAFLIEKDLKAGYDRISQNGDWKTAYYELSQVTVSYPFIQPYMDIALSFILNYIAENYDS